MMRGYVESDWKTDPRRPGAEEDYVGPLDEVRVCYLERGEAPDEYVRTEVNGAYIANDLGKAPDREILERLVRSCVGWSGEEPWVEGALIYRAVEWGGMTWWAFSTLSSFSYSGWFAVYPDGTLWSDETPPTEVAK